MNSAQDWLDRTDPRAKALSDLANETTEADQAATKAQLEDANRRVFIRECEAEGLDPARGVSPALLKTLGA